MRLTVIGCSPAWPNPGGANAGYLVEGPHGRVMLDCGPGVLSRLIVQEGGWPRVDAILLSHLHLDHWGDVLGWLWGTLGGPGVGRPAPSVWIASGRGAELHDVARRLGDFNGMLDVAFGVHEHPVGEPFSVAGFEVLAASVPHYRMSTCGFRLSDGESVLAYSADSGPAESLVELARGADLFLCEATLADGVDEGQPRGHLSASEAVEVHQAAGAARLLLTHRPAGLPMPPGIELASEGLTVEVAPNAERAAASSVG